MFFHKDQSEMSAVYNEISTIPFSSEDNLESNSEKDSKASSPASGFQRCRVSTVILGLLAVVQLAVIICLALHIEANNKNVTEEKDELKRALNDSSLQLNSLTQGNDKLKKINSEIVARSKNLTEDRNELKAKLDDLVSRQNTMIEERDNLTRINADTQTSCRRISLERDQLRERLNILAQPGWIIFRQSAYYMSSTTKTWQESRDHCRSLGTDLMIINSKEEQVFANGFKKYMWIGLTDSEGEGRWKWVDGTPMNTNYWSENEPNGKTEENCADIKSFEIESSWNDESCSHKLNWICEMKLNP
ncbi:CD209 antigen-like [Cyprinodon tularosa]|uniref:CD209 antigen-like n=1 Tax=Cyprinodon tularosa TaxID=77115 RepID=UPI0018E25688|nr:CD209 antigen-like [Cyprinodon tularosa]